MALHDPAIAYDSCGSHADQWRNDLKASGFNRKITQILLLCFGDLHPACFGMPTEIPVEELSGYDRSCHAAKAGGNVAKTDLQRVEVVLFSELGRHTAEDHVISSEQCAGIENDQAGFLLDKDVNRFERIGARLEVRSRFPLWDITCLALLSQMQVGQD